MMRAIAKAPLTAIREPRRSSTERVQVMPPNREKLSVAARTRAVRIYHEAAEIVEALTAGAVAGNQQPRSGEDVTALLLEVSGEVKRGNRAAGVIQAAGACPQAVVPEAEDPAVAGPVAVVAEVVAVEADDKNWIKMFNIIDSMEEKRCLLKY
jgi:hypothetical protein